MLSSQPASALVSDNWMDQDQHASFQDVHPELQSYFYDVGLEAG